jgi:hypothetical protein
MITNSKLIGPLLGVLLLWLSIAAVGQVLPHQPDQLSNDYQPYPLRQTPFCLELNLILQPVYVFQRSSSEYRLNGQPLNIPKSFLPRFYSTQPFQKAFSSIGETADQANSLYGSFYLTFLENSAVPFLHHIRLVVGATHEKLEADSPVRYGYFDGGTEATFLLEKNIAYRLSIKQYEQNGILFGINAQTGFFGSVAKVRTKINYNGYVINSTDMGRWQWPNPRNNWGLMGGANVEVGGVISNDGFWHHVGVTVATKVMAIVLHSVDNVTASGVPGGMTGGKLRMNNFAIFLNGPIICVKWMNKN